MLPDGWLSDFHGIGSALESNCMESGKLILFLIASLAVTLAPGPDNLFVLSQGIHSRRQSALLAAWGMVSGLSVHTLLAVLGVSALIVASPLLFGGIQAAGAAYLLYLAFVTLRTGTQVELESASLAVSDAGMFRRGFLMNVLNPKVALFFLAFLPQFVVPDAGHARVQMLLLGGLFMVQAWICFSIIALAASGIGSLLRRRAGFARGLNIASGLILASLALNLIFELMVSS